MKVIVFVGTSLVLVSAAVFFYPSPQSKAAPPEIMLGQNFIVGVLGRTFSEETKAFLEQIKPGGVILYSRNYDTRAQFKALIAELQKTAETTTGYPYFIMIDEEPGGATRLNLFKNVFETGAPKWEEIERDIKEIKNIGITVNLAPLADFPFGGDSYIKHRVPFKAPEALMDFNRKFIALLQQNGISATLKHFPGIGIFSEDPHAKIIETDIDEAMFNESLKIFESGIIDGANFVMTSHAVYNNIDQGLPATLSSKITTEMLRENLGFSGLIITDDIPDMSLVTHGKMNITEATIKSLKAGHDMVMFSHQPEITRQAFGELLERIQKDPAVKSVIENNYRKIVSFKEK